MDETLLNGLLFFGIIQAFFFSLLFLTKKEKILPDNIIGFWLIILAFQIFLITLKNHKNLNFIDNSHFQLLFTLLHGPLLYLYTQKLVLGENSFKQKDVSHFVPFIIGFLLSLIALIPEINQLLFIKIIAIAGVLSGLCYCFLTLHLLQKHKNIIKNSFSFTDKINLKWLTNLTEGVLAIWIGASILVILYRFYHIHFSLIWFFLVVPVFIFYIGYYGIRQQIIYPLSNNNNGKNKLILSNKKIKKKRDSYKKSGLQNNDMKNIHERLLKAMQNDKLFINPLLNLAELSKKLNIPAHHITQTLNDYVSENFYDFVNKFRVKELIERIQKGDCRNFSLLGLAFDSGFNSKSSFNRVFKKFTGQSPSEYKKNHTS